MKRNLIKLISVLMIVFVGAMTFVGCGDGAFKGDYEKATADSLYDALKDVDFDKVFGDYTADDWAFGFEYSEETTEYSYQEDKDAKNINEETNEYSLTQVLAMSFKKVDDANTLVLKGNGKLTEKATSYEKETEELEEGEEGEPIVIEGEYSEKAIVSNQFDGEFVYVTEEVEYNSENSYGKYKNTSNRKFKYDLTTEEGQADAGEFAGHYQDSVDMTSMFSYIDFTDENLAKTALKAMIDESAEYGLEISLAVSEDEIKIKSEVVDVEKYTEMIKSMPMYKEWDEVVVDFEESTSILVLSKDGEFKAMKTVEKGKVTVTDAEEGKMINETDSVVEAYAFDGKTKKVKKADKFIENDYFSPSDLY